MFLPSRRDTGFFRFEGRAIIIPQPHADESENDFIVRAHRALAVEYPETDERNAIVFRAWRDAKGQTDLEKRAYEKFGDELFEHARDVPVFPEHSRQRFLKHPDGSLQTDDAGNPVTAEEKYDLDALLKVCDRCNYRIADTGNFATLSEGHTPTIEERQNGVKSPPILGFSGPFRVGMIGNKNPRWAIFADEHYYRSDVEKVRRMPTRSPEVWLKQDMAQRFMDPIAMLGSETPWNDMGVRFALAESGEQVEKYAASMTAAATGFAPSEVVIPKERYDEGEQPNGAAASTPDEFHDNTEPPPGKGTLMLDPEDIKQIVDAVMQTDVMQWCKTKMAAEADMAAKVKDAPPIDQAAAPEAPQGGQPAPGAPAAGDAPPATDPATGAPVPDAAAPPTLPGAPGEPGEEAGGTNDNATPPAADGPPAGDEPPKEKDKYAMVDEKIRYAKLEKDLADERAARIATEKRLEKIESESRDKERYSRLRELSTTHTMNLAKEFESAKGMTDDQFVSHLERIVENYSRIPVGTSLHVPETIEDADVERYRRECVQEAMEEVTKARAAGNHGVKYDDCLRAAQAKRKAPPSIRATA